MHQTVPLFNLCLIADYCMFEFFNPQCQPGEVIIMQEAKYGRMNVGKCIDSGRELGCYADVLETFDRLCSFKQMCNVQLDQMILEVKVHAGMKWCNIWKQAICAGRVRICLLILIIIKTF